MESVVRISVFPQSVAQQHLLDNIVRRVADLRNISLCLLSGLLSRDARDAARFVMARCDDPARRIRFRCQVACKVIAVTESVILTVDALGAALDLTERVVFVISATRHAADDARQFSSRIGNRRRVIVVSHIRRAVGIIADSEAIDFIVSILRRHTARVCPREQIRIRVIRVESRAVLLRDDSLSEAAKRIVDEASRLTLLNYCHQLVERVV